MLRKAQADWSLTRGDNEVDLTGSGRAAFEVEEQGLQDIDFLDMLTRLQGGPRTPGLA